jgi:hypothetical protein
MSVEGVQELLNKNIGKYSVSQQTVIVKGEEQSEYVVNCRADSGDLMFYESQLAYCLNQHLAKLNEAESDTGGVVQFQTITLSRDLTWSQFDYGRDQRIRDLQTEAIINRDGDQKRDKVIGGISGSVSDMQKEVTGINNTNGWQNGILFALTVGLVVAVFYFKSRLRHRGSYNRAYGYGYNPNPEPKSDITQVEKKLVEETDKRLKTIQNSVDDRVNERVEERMNEAYELLRLEFSPTPKRDEPVIDPEGPDKVEDPTAEETDLPTNVDTPQVVETAKLEVIPLPDNFTEEIIEPEMETQPQAAEIMPDKIVDEIDVKPEVKIERKNDSAADKDGFNDEDQALYKSLAESFPVEACSPLSNNCYEKRGSIL